MKSREGVGQYPLRTVLSKYDGHDSIGVKPAQAALIMSLVLTKSFTDSWTKGGGNRKLHDALRVSRRTNVHPQPVPHETPEPLVLVFSKSKSTTEEPPLILDAWGLNQTCALIMCSSRLAANNDAR